MGGEEIRAQNEFCVGCAKVSKKGDCGKDSLLHLERVENGEMIECGSRVEKPTTK